MLRLPLTCGTLVVALVLFGGCQPKEEPPKTVPPVKAVPQKTDEAPAKAARKHGRRTELPPAVKVETPKPPEPKAIPKVSLSAETQAATRVKVGDKLPGGEMPDLAGKAQAVEKLLGPKLTVLFFWTADNRHAVTELEDLQADVFQPLAAKGVQVVGVNVDQDAAKARQAVERAGAKFSVLLDPGKKYFDKLATDKPTRTYLIDASGVVRWFDVEYSRTTARDLLAGIEFILGEAGNAPPAKR
jgi:peroxiredoxin